MSEKKLVGTVAVDGGEIAIVDPSHLKNTELVAGDLLKIETAIVAGMYPIYFEKDDDEGGKNNSEEGSNPNNNVITIK